VSCPISKKLLGGGARLSLVNGEVFLINSYPSTAKTWSASADESIWGFNNPAGTTADWTITAYVICATIEE
jgi:hypothetical protein